MPVSKDFREIFTAEIISMTGGLLAGSMLAVYIGNILLVPGLFILLPGFLEMRGNISGSLAARLGSALHLGSIKPEIKNNALLRQNLLAGFFLAISVALTLSAVAYMATKVLFGTATLEIIWIAVLAALLSNLFEIPITVLTTFWLFKKGYDPNNIMGPYVTTTGDIISVASLLLAILIVTWH